MVRVKRGNVLRKKHKKILKLAKGFKGGRKRIFKAANEAVMRALRFQYRDRRNKKREFRRLWITRINAAAKLNGITYSKFIRGLKLANVSLNRKMLADIAVRDEAAFKKIADLAKEKLAEAS
ncbi:MAG: 50S ribosomal protein L20 [Cyanobacteriota bacterium]